MMGSHPLRFGALLVVGGAVIVLSLELARKLRTQDFVKSFSGAGAVVYLSGEGMTIGGRVIQDELAWSNLCKVSMQFRELRRSLVTIDIMALEPKFMSRVAQLSNIERLSLLGGEIDGELLRCLANSYPTLRELRLPATELVSWTPQDFKLFRHLSRLQVSASLLGDEKFVRLKEGLPGVIVEGHSGL